MKKLIMLLGGWCFCWFVYLIIGNIISPQPNVPHIPSHDEIGINDAKNREEAVKIALFTDRHLVHANNFDFVLENMLHKAFDEIRDKNCN